MDNSFDDMRDDSTQEVANTPHLAPEAETKQALGAESKLFTMTSILTGDAFNFSTLSQELPDPNQELFVQLSQPLDVFHVFRKLPPEIRLKIWRLTFPKGRNINLDINSCFSSSEIMQWYRKRTIRHLPVTLRVTQESRSETLRHYVVLFQGDVLTLRTSLDGRIWDRPFCINPKLVSVWCPVRRTANGMLWMHQWLGYIDSKLPQGLKSIRSLELCNFHLFESDLNPAEVWGVRKDHYRRGLEWFHGLRSLHLVFGVSSPAGEANRVNDWYREYQLQVPECRIPEITIRGWGQPEYFATM